jgi:gas vesicle protein
MRRLMMFAGGLMCGALIGATVVLLLTPNSGESVREDTKDRVDGAMSEAKRAAERRRRELEAELEALTNPQPARPALKR